jgi:hypothetical protein
MINVVEYILRVLQAKKITFHSYDLASDEDAKRLWRRKAPVGERRIFCTALAVHSNESRVPDKQQLPGILVGGTCPGVGSSGTLAANVHADFFAVFRRLVSILPR